MYAEQYDYYYTPEPYGYDEWDGYGEYADPNYAYDEYAGGYDDPYGYDWTMTEYPEDSDDGELTSAETKGRFDPRYER